MMWMLGRLFVAVPVLMAAFWLGVMSLAIVAMITALPGSRR